MTLYSELPQHSANNSFNFQEIKAKISKTLRLITNSSESSEGISEEILASHRHLIEKICEEITILFISFKEKLDENWLDEFCDARKTHEKLFELIILKQFIHKEKVAIEKYQLKTEETPDFYITHGNLAFIAEAISVGVPNDPASEMQKIIEIFKMYKTVSTDDYDRKKLINEYKSRLTHAIKKKEKYKDLVQNKSNGFILFISFSKIPFVTKPDVFTLVHALYGCGDFTYLIDPHSKQYVDSYYGHQAEFQKNSASSISNQFLLEEQNKWISAIVLSPQDSFLMLDSAAAPWSHEHKNDFVVVHNPIATIPLQNGILPVNTEINLSLADSTIIQHGARIFPEY